MNRYTIRFQHHRKWGARVHLRSKLELPTERVIIRYVEIAVGTQMDEVDTRVDAAGDLDPREGLRTAPKQTGVACVAKVAAEAQANREGTHLYSLEVGLPFTYTLSRISIFG